jgi:hypothetical protein
MHSQIYNRNCVQCIQPFSTIYPDKKYCSLQCKRSQARRERDLVCTACQLPFRGCQRGGTKPKYCPTCRRQKLSDLTGQRFGKLVVLGPADKRYFYKCLCDCGATKSVFGYRLRTGRKKSCDVGLCRQLKHGHSHCGVGGRSSPTYISWKKMNVRCLNPNHEKYANYGAIGITVCERWRGRKGGFFNFLADLGERPEGTTLGRFGDTGNYEPGNVAWQTQAEQVANRRPDRNYRREKRVSASTPDFVPALVESASCCRLNSLSK